MATIIESVVIMNDILHRLYQSYFNDTGLHPIKSNDCSPGYGFALDRSVGEGYYWIYSVQDHFVVSSYSLKYNIKQSTIAKQPEATILGFCDASNAKDWFGCTQNKKNQLISYTSADDFVTVQANPGDYVNCKGIVFTPEFYKKRIEPLTDQSYKTFSKNIQFLNGCHNFPELNQIIDNLIALPSKSKQADILMESQLLNLIGQILSNKDLFDQVSKQPKSLIDNRHLKIVQNHIDTHFTKVIKLDELVQLSCMSKSKLLQLFKSYYGITITSYIRQKRIQASKRMLISTNFSLSFIANRVGYKCHSSFSDAFKSLEGITPSEYRMYSLKKINSLYAKN